VTRWSGSVFRATTWDVPLWVNPNRRDGRWNRAGHGCTQYACLDPEGPYAELLRAERLRTEAEAATLKTDLWELRVDEGAVADYRTFDRAEAAGFPPEALIDDDHERCRAEAEYLRRHNVRGLLVPSAALPGSIGLVLFGPRVSVEWSATAGLAAMVPARRLAQGPPPSGLAAKVRHYGEPHWMLDEFRAEQKRLFP
jgi:RES domain-containing protein